MVRKTVEEAIKKLRAAWTGREVRDRMADTIEAMNEEVTNTSSKQSILEETFNNLIINEGNSNAEVVAARVDQNGNSYDTLGKRMNNFDEQLDSITTYITPEMFGCIGDGIIDDTVNLQRCIDYAISKKVSIKSKSYKKYKISDTINVNGTVNIDFNNSTLLATTKSDVININHVGVNTFNGTIENLIIDCNDISECGLKITYSQRRLFKSVKVINLKAIGIDIVAGNVNKFSYIWIEGKNVNINTIGFRNNCYDMVVSHMDIINCHVSIEHNRGNCFYSECHGFITNPDILYKDSIFYKQTCYHHVVLDKCYPDTQQYWYYISDIAKLNIIGNYGFTSNEILNSNTFADGTRGYIFFFEDSNQRYSSRVSISDSMLQGIKIDGINRYLFTNLADENSLIKINSTVHPYNFDALRTCSTNALTNLNSQITFNKNIIKLAKETYTLQVEFEYNPSILGVLSSTIGRSIGNLPSSYMYVSDGDFSFPVEYGIIDEQGYKCLGFLKGLVKSNSETIYLMSLKEMYDSRIGICDPRNNTDYYIKINAVLPMYSY